MLYMLEWMQKEKYRIETPRIQGLRGLALSAYIHRRTFKGYIFIM